MVNSGNQNTKQDVSKDWKPVFSYEEETWAEGKTKEYFIFSFSLSHCDTMDAVNGKIINLPGLSSYSPEHITQDLN